MKRRISQSVGRRGFTLVEMLIVIGLFMLLAGLTVAFLANFRGSAASQGTSQLYGWLNMARQRAIRDRNPYGLRLVLNPNNPGQVDQLQYIEQPEDYWIPGSTYVSTTTVAPFTAMFQNADFTGGFPNDPTLWPVQANDYLEVNGGGKVHLIQNVVSNGQGLVLASQPDAPSGTGWQYRVIRRSRVVGEDALKLPQGVVINLQQVQSTAPTYGPASAPFDILFGPKGQVIGSAAAFDKIVLWIHETTGAPTDATDPTRDPNLIVINTRSGSIAAYRVDTTGTDPYSETRTGQTSPE